MKYIAQIVYIVIMISYISLMKVGDINHIIIYYSGLWGALLLLNFHWKNKKELMLSVLNIILWLGFIIDNLLYWNGDLTEYLTHYNKNILAVIGLLYIIILIIITCPKKKKR